MFGVRPHVPKLDPSSLKCISLDYSQVQKRYRCYCPTLRRYFVSTDVTFFEITLFSLSSPVTSQGGGGGGDDDLLVYTITSLAPLAPTLALVPIKPPITQVYSLRQNPPTSSPTQAASSSNPIQNDDLPIALHKGKHQCAHPISSFVSYNRLSSSSCSFIASLGSIHLPNIVREALSHPSWRSAMMEETQTLDDNGSWSLVRYLLRRKSLDAVGFLKVNPDGSVARLKA